MKIGLNRRNFLLFTNGLIATFFFGSNRDKLVLLKKNSEHLVGPNTKLKLPENPKPGDFVYLIVPPESAHRSAQVMYTETPILRDSEDLVLDSIGNYKLSYKSKRTGWVLV